MKKRSILAGILAVLMMLVALSGCTSKTTTSDEETATLRVLWWGAQERHDNTIKVIDMYEEKVGNVKFEPEFMGNSGYSEKIATLAAANNLPDIAQFNLRDISPYAKSGHLLDLTEYIESGVLDLSDVSEEVKDSGKAYNGTYALSLGSNTHCIAYNADLLKKAGIEEIPNDWTWEDMEDIFAKIEANTDAYAIESVNYALFHYYLRLNGKHLYNEEGTALAYEDDKLFSDFFDKYMEYIDKGYCIPPEELIAPSSFEEGKFAKGEVAMMLCWSNTITPWETDFEVKIAPLPDNGTTNAMYLKPAMYFAVSSRTKYPEEAAAFLSYFTNDVEANKILNADRGVPIAAKVREALVPGLNDSQKKVFDFIDFITENSTAMDPLPPNCNNELETLLSEMDEKIRFRKISTTDAAKEFRKKAEAIFANSNK